MPATTDILTVNQAAAELGISPRTVLHHITVGKLAADKLDPSKRTSAYVIHRDEVDRAKTDDITEPEPVPVAVAG